MGISRFHMTTSLDGYVAGPDQGPDRPFGRNTEHLNDWMFLTRTAHEMVGEDGGETGPSDDVFAERLANIGATIMGRNMFGGGPGPWPEEEWKGWWGPNPPYHTPVYVLTHYEREPLPMEGGTTFHFVTDGIKAAHEQARRVAGDADVLIAGGADVVNQFLIAGLVDEFELHVVPQVLGRGERLFSGVAPLSIELAQVRAIGDASVTHLKYRVSR